MPHALLLHAGNVAGICVQTIFEDFSTHLAERHLYSVSEQVMLWPLVVLLDRLTFYVCVCLCLSNVM